MPSDAPVTDNPKPDCVVTETGPPSLMLCVVSLLEAGPEQTDVALVVQLPASADCPVESMIPSASSWTTAIPGDNCVVTAR